MLLNLTFYNVMSFTYFNLKTQMQKLLEVLIVDNYSGSWKYERNIPSTKKDNVSFRLINRLCYIICHKLGEFRRR